MKDDLNFSGNGRRPQFFKEMEDNLNFSGNGRRPQFQEALFAFAFDLYSSISLTLFCISYFPIYVAALEGDCNN